jgi:hypothetical protein
MSDIGKTIDFYEIAVSAKEIHGNILLMEKECHPGRNQVAAETEGIS